MDDEKINISVRKFLKNVGITSQRKIEEKIRDKFKSGEIVDVAGSGSPLLWQHLFWFLAHPEVYVLILPALGIVGEILANNTRKPIWGFKSIIYSG